MFRYVLCLLLYLIPQICAADVRLAVLEFRGVGVSSALLQLLTDEARSGVLRVSKGQKIDGETLIIMTRENMLQVLKDQGLRAEDCKGECEVEIAKNIGADYVMSGNLTKIDTLFALVIKLHSTRDSNLLASESIKTKSKEGLIVETEKVGSKVFYEGLELGEYFDAGSSNFEEGFSGGNTSSWSANQGKEKVLVSFSSSPSGATVLIDGKLVCPSTPCSRGVSKGRHQVSIQKERYKSWNKRKNFQKEEKVVAELTPEFGYLSVSGSHSGVSLHLDGKYLGKTPILDAEVDAGAHTISVEDPCYMGQNFKYKARAGKEEKVSSYSFTERPSGIEVRAIHEGNDVAAQIRVDGKYVGDSPGTFTIGVCSKEVTARYRGKEIRKAVSLKEKKVKEVVFQWEQETRSTPSINGWTRNIKKQFLSSCTTSIPAGVSSSEMQEICQCSMDKLEELFTPEQLNSPDVLEYARSIGKMCAGGERGAWNTPFKEYFMNSCLQGMKDANRRGSCQCIMKKLEVRFDPIDLDSSEAEFFTSQIMESCVSDY